MKMKKFLTVVFASLAALLLFTCASAKPVVRDPTASYELVVLHTNDHHGHPVAFDGGNKTMVGGLAERATFVKGVRAAYKNVLVLDAGDVNTGAAVSNMFRAEPDILGYNAIGYNAATFGNHEFDKPLSVLRNQMRGSSFPWLSANITQANGKYLGKPYMIKDYDGFRVAVIGLTTVRSLTTSQPDKSLTFINEIDAAKEMVKTVREKEYADIVIILGHLGDVLETEDQITSKKLAAALSSDEVALIVDGHSHTKMDAPLVVNGIPIVSANEWGKYMGEAVLSITDGKVTSFAWEPVAITSTAFPPDARVADLLSPYVAKATERLKEVVMKTSAEFEFGARLTRYQEMPIGNLCADALAWYCREQQGQTIDFAIQNGGGIRAALPAGDVIRERIMDMLPFENYIYVCTVKGSDVRDLFNFIGTIPQGAGGFAQVSKGVKYTITYDKSGKGTISNVTINGEAIDPNKVYKIATNDFMAKGGDGYVALTKSIDMYNTSMMPSDIVIEYAATLPQPVKPATDGRITVIGGVTP